MGVGDSVGSVPRLATSAKEHASMNSTRDERPRRVPLTAAIPGLGLGLMFLAIGLNRPTIANMRTVDLIYLLGTGACLGAGLMGLITYFIDRRKG